jgi:hypothetical protein
MPQRYLAADNRITTAACRLSNTWQMHAFLSPATSVWHSRSLQPMFFLPDHAMRILIATAFWPSICTSRNVPAREREALRVTQKNLEKASLPVHDIPAR